MGKGNILSNLGNGKYEVEVVYNTERLDSAIQKLEKEIDKVKYNVIPDLEDTESNAKDKVDSAETDLQNAIDKYMEEQSEENEKAVDEANKKYLQALGEYQKAVMELKDKELELESFQKRKDFLQDNYPENEIKEMWCADYSNHLSGEVGTVEIPGSMQYMQIRPGYDGKASFDSSRDGQLYPTVALPPAGAFYNLAMLPGWQKWIPRYRLGTIQNIDIEKNTGDVTLDNVNSENQNLDVNLAPPMLSVPIEYMSCDSGAFIDGDRVLVEFVSWWWEYAKVIGFEKEPRLCGIFLKLRINGHKCSRSHEVGLMDKETKEIVASGLTDETGFIAFPQTHSALNLIPVLGRGGSHPFDHFIEAGTEPDNPMEVSYELTFNLYKTEDDQGNKDTILECDPFSYQTRLFALKWYQHDKVLDEVDTISETVFRETRVVYDINFTGCKVVRQREKRQIHEEVDMSQTETNTAESGFFKFSNNHGIPTNNFKGTMLDYSIFAWAPDDITQEHHMIDQLIFTKGSEIEPESKKIKAQKGVTFKPNFPYSKGTLVFPSQSYVDANNIEKNEYRYRVRNPGTSAANVGMPDDENDDGTYEPDWQTEESPLFGDVDIVWEIALPKFDWEKVELKSGCIDDGFSFVFEDNENFIMHTNFGEYCQDKYHGNINSDFSPIDSVTGNPMFTIHTEAWSGVWEAGDWLSFNVVLGVFDIKIVEDWAWIYYKFWDHQGVKTNDTTHRHRTPYAANGESEQQIDYSLYRHGWRGVFNAGDVIKINAKSRMFNDRCGEQYQGWQLYHFQRGSDQLEERVKYPRGDENFHNLKLGIYKSLLDIDAPNEALLNPPIRYDWEGLWIHFGVKQSIDTLKPEFFFPMCKSKDGRNPTMQGVTISIDMYAVTLHTIDTDPTGCPIPGWETITFEMVDTPPEFI